MKPTSSDSSKPRTLTFVPKAGTPQHPPLTFQEKQYTPIRVNIANLATKNVSTTKTLA